VPTAEVHLVQGVLLATLDALMASAVIMSGFTILRVSLYHALVNAKQTLCLQRLLRLQQESEQPITMSAVLSLVRIFFHS
jgi:hypothetical protein